MSAERRRRLVEIDALRGVAILMMVIYHLLFDLWDQGLIGVWFRSWFWVGWGLLTAVLFLSLVGVSLSLWYTDQGQKLSMPQLVMACLKKGGFILGWGLVITVVTNRFFPGQTVWFGILHLIGVSIMTSFIFLKLHSKLSLVSLAIVVAGLVLHSFRWSTGWLLPLGFIPANFNSLDYYPLFPWMGLIVAGIGIGRKYFPQGRASKRGWEIPVSSLVNSLEFLGRHSLLIYLVHQPILLLGLWLVFKSSSF